MKPYHWWNSGEINIVTWKERVLTETNIIFFKVIKPKFDIFHYEVVDTTIDIKEKVDSLFFSEPVLNTKEILLSSFLEYSKLIWILTSFTYSEVKYLQKYIDELNKDLNFSLQENREYFLRIYNWNIIIQNCIKSLLENRTLINRKNLRNIFNEKIEEEPFRNNILSILYDSINESILSNNIWINGDRRNKEIYCWKI
jgi:hypothetical protein